MHLIVREGRDLDEASPPQDLALAPADLVFLSFSDADLASVIDAWRACPEAHRPSLRAVNLARLTHPMSVDLFLDSTIAGSKAVAVRLLGGLDYWRYGAEQLSRRCRDLGIRLVFVPGDGRPDPRLPALSTVGAETLAAIEALLDAGGRDNIRAALQGLLANTAGVPWPEARPVAGFGVYKETASAGAGRNAAIIFYRSHVMAGDTAPVDALFNALGQRGLSVSAFFVPSLKDSESAQWLERSLSSLKPDVIINATAFAARDGNDTSPLDSADCPVLQVAMAGSSRADWAASTRGLSPADLAMFVVMPEIDGRIFAGAISFKEREDASADLGCSIVRHAPDLAGIDHVADLASAWVQLRGKPAGERRVALMLSTYPGRPDQIAHAVGLDALESTLQIANHLGRRGYRVLDSAENRGALVKRLDAGLAYRWPVSEYRRLFADLPQAFQDRVTEAWGDPDADSAVIDGAFAVRGAPMGGLIIALQPERGPAQNRKAQYHDTNTPPRHSYIALYLWLRHAARIDALVHLGAHGTLEWLPGKAIALSAACAPRAVLGPVPLIYPFIVNDPGEAAQAKRRISAVTLGHRPPPLIGGEVPAALREVERLVDEFASADGLDPNRRKALAGKIVEAAANAGLSDACGLTPNLSEAGAINRIDAFLCDVKELSIRDGLHIADETECTAIATALDGRFIEPGPSGAPSRGRADVLPTGRNLYAIDPRAIPTQTAWANGRRSADAILDRYSSDHGAWPRSIVLDLWGSATLRTGGEELACALALLGVRPVWDSRSYRVTGVETLALAELGRPRVDVTLRISGLFRDMFASQLALFQSAVALVAGLAEDSADNPLAGRDKQNALLRIFGPAEGSFGAGIMPEIDSGAWQTRGDLGQAYLDATTQAYAGAESASGPESFKDRVQSANAFFHAQDHRETDLLTGGDFAAHEGGFAAAAAAAGNTSVALYHGDTSVPDAPRIRTLQEECARIVHGRAANPRWIEGQMRHGFRGGSEMAATVDAAFAFAATSASVQSGEFERLYQAYLGDPTVAAFLARENPAARDAMQRRFEEAIRRGLWHPRRNDVLREAAE